MTCPDCLSPAQRNALAYLSCGTWRHLNFMPGTISALYRLGLIHCGGEDGSLRDRIWQVTDEGAKVCREMGQ